MAHWVDTRPERPSGSYLVGGVEFKGGEAKTGPLTAGGRALFESLGIVPADEAPADAPEVVENDLGPGAVIADDSAGGDVEASPLTAEESAAVEASGIEPPVLTDAAPKRAARTRGAK